MKEGQILILFLIFITISTTKAQEPIIINGYCTDMISITKETTRELFIQEQAQVAFTDYSTYKLVLDKESAERLGTETITLIFVNDLASMITSVMVENPTTFEVFHLKDHIYYCKHYEFKKESYRRDMKIYEDLEQEITRILENPVEGDTLKDPQPYLDERAVHEKYIDSRYTPLLIKNLTSDVEICIQGNKSGHGIITTETVRKRFFGLIKIKTKTSRAGGWAHPYLYTMRMSDLARECLCLNFHLTSNWSFTRLPCNASAEEWQTWLNNLLKNNE